MCVQGSESGSCSWSDSDSDSGSSSCSSGSACSSGRSSHTHQTFSIRETNFDQVCNISSSSSFFSYLFLCFPPVLQYGSWSMLVVQGYRFKHYPMHEWLHVLLSLTSYQSSAKCKLESRIYTNIMHNFFSPDASRKTDFMVWFRHVHFY